MNLFHVFNCFYDVWFGRIRAKNFKNRAFFLHFLEFRLKLIFSKFYNYAFRPSRKALKDTKHIKRSWKIRFQFLKCQNRPSNDEKKTKCPNKLAKILDILQKRFHGIGDISLIFQYFLSLFFCIAFYTF